MSLFTATAAVIPFEFVNNSQFADGDIFVALVGQQNGTAVWMDFDENDASGAGTKAIAASYNTMNKTDGDWGYADIFTRLSEIKDKTVYMPDLTACRIFVSFNGPMYIHFFDGGGYAGANLQNPSDPNAGLRFEIVEFSNASNGMWLNTTRVDAFQYPMGVELWGAAGANNAYMKAGELLSYSQIIDRWKTTFGSDADFAACYREVITMDDLGGIIEQPSKLSSFKEGGSSQNYFQDYIDAVWEYYASHTLVADQGERGVWTGSITDGKLTMTSSFNGGSTAHIYSKPTTQDIIEGKGALAEGDDNDKALQAQFCGAMTRGVVSLTDGATQYWGDETKFFVPTDYNTWNRYVEFFHDEALSYDGKTYAFAYDDTFDQSSTLVTSIPSKARVTIGGFYEGGSEPVEPVEPVDPENPDTPGSATKTGSGSVNGLNYEYSLAYASGSLTVSFTVTNPEDFSGLVPVIFDRTGGGLVEFIGTAGAAISNSYAYAVGTETTFQAKWMYAGGEALSETISFTIPSSSAVEETKADTEAISLYPMPCSTAAYISGTDGPCDYAVYDLSGALKLSGNGTRIDVAALSEGMYVVVVEGVVVKMVVKRD